MQIKRILEKRINIILGVSLLITGIAIGVGATAIIPLTANPVRVKSQPQLVKVTDETEIKKQALAKFYNEIITAQDKQDWATLYVHVRQSVRDNVTKEQFIAYQQAQLLNQKQVYSKSQGKVIDAFVSKNTIVNNIEINGDNGTIDRTIITCITKECTDGNRQEDSAKKQYVYIKGKWQIPDPEPSERALKAANYGYQNSSKNDQKDLINDFGYGSDSSTYTVRNWAVSLDGNLEELIRVETIVEQDKLDRSRPIYNQQPAQIIQQPAPIINQPAPIIQQQTYPRNCTSNTIGNYTYTNCY